MTARRSTLQTIVLLGLCAAVAGCGKSLPKKGAGGGGEVVTAIGAHGAAGVSTRNTTRLGGADASTDAAAIALTIYPGLTRATRPRSMLIAALGDWPGALAASALAGPPLHAPLLYSQGAALPDASRQALSVLRPTGAAQLGFAQAIYIGETSRGIPSALAAYHVRTVIARGAARLAVALERLWSVLHRRNPTRVIVTSASGPPAMAMPAAGLAAQSDTPILFVERTRIPAATRAELARLGHVQIYLIGPDGVVGSHVAGELGRYGTVTRIAGHDPASNAVAVARFTNGSFGWGVEEPGHGLAFANASRPFDAPAAATLSASGDYAPLLLLESPDRLPASLSEYLSDLQPGSPPSGPVHGVYNHGWLIGDEDAISAITQARLDRLLEISSQPASESSLASQTPIEEEARTDTQP